MASSTPPKSSSYKNKLPQEWSIEEVVQWAGDQDALEGVVASLQVNDIRGKVLLELSDEEIKTDLGITSLGTRRLLKSAIAEFKTQSTPNNDNDNDNNTTASSSTGSEMEHWKIDPQSVELVKKIGSGNFGLENGIELLLLQSKKC